MTFPEMHKGDLIALVDLDGSVERMIVADVAGDAYTVTLDLIADPFIASDS